MFFQLLFLLSLLFLIINSSSSVRPPCLDYESNALLQFKHSFLINEDVSSDPLAYPKVESWKPNKDCCSWNGVKCDDETSHVISLDLSSSFLYGSMNSNSSLFRLVYLQTLNLADNDFNYSSIPSQIYHLSELRYLNLSFSNFYGQIPLEVSKLSSLVSLDFSLNRLNLKNYNLRRLVENLTNLEELQLSYVNTSSLVPNLFASITSLRSLVLKSCGLFGMFPIKIFYLPNLQFLDLGNNQYLNGYLPEFKQSSRIKSLRVFNTNFSGRLPDSIGNLNSLLELTLERNNLFGSLPCSLGNLTDLQSLSLSNNNFGGIIPPSLANLTELYSVSLGSNSFNFENLEWLGRLKKLVVLSLSDSNLIGNIPPSLRNLTQLQAIYLGRSQLNGQIPVWLSNHTQLTLLSLEKNQIHGPIPQSFSQLVNLEILIMSQNNLDGIVKLDMFSNMKKLYFLEISSDSSSIIAKLSANVTLPKFKILGLGGCNLNEFPPFLKYQDRLESLVLEGNNIHGVIPEWVWNASRNSLWHISFANNNLTGFATSSQISQLKNLQTLQLGSNKLQGPIPVPSSSIIVYDLSNNMISGSISPLICWMRSLVILDLSNNSLSGKISDCFGNFSNSLKFLNLEMNSLSGNIPQMCFHESVLRMIDLSHNQLVGNLPRSFANCTRLESLDISHNHISDKFPSFLGSLRSLQVLDLKSNKFYGAIANPPTSFEFPMLQILDLSQNAFDGNLPRTYFQIWNSMKFFVKEHLAYMKIDVDFNSSEALQSASFYYSMVLTKAGVELNYTKVLKADAAIDLSNNKFSGEIPESLGDLKMLRLLNLANNFLTGQIPSSFGKLRALESLDLSLNNLTGQIPQELVPLTFLGFLNVSDNHLSGPIPHGNQFDTYQNSSFERNSGLCGKPLSKLCGNDEDPSSPNSTHEEEDDESSSLFDLDWIVISIGFIGGIVVGVVMGQFFYAWKYEWFVKASTTGRPTRRRRINNR